MNKIFISFILCGVILVVTAVRAQHAPRERSTKNQLVERRLRSDPQRWRSPVPEVPVLELPTAIPEVDEDDGSDDDASDGSDEAWGAETVSLMS